MKILLTGSAGFTGHHFAVCAQAAGHAVLPLQADLTDKAAVAAEVLQAAPDAVVHLAAISFVGHADDSDFYRVNVIGTMNLLTALAELPRPPAKVLLASSANIYGNCDASPIGEDQSPAPVNHYATSKLAMEHMARTWSERLPIVITRPFNYTGAGQGGQFLIPKLVDHFARKAPCIELGNLHVEREFNDVRMVCNAYMALLSHGQAGQAYNVCTGQTYTLQNVLERLTAITGHALEVQVNPAFVRANEVHRLCGNPTKLLTCVGPLPGYALSETLQWMLEPT
ncbi:MAG: GDP-mannose 4,6-dehydratase [Burkholderiaceae bacterium]|jgi:nucleoside-diphosphate-sugar epimerase